MVGIGHEGGDEDSNSDFGRELVHGEGYIDAAEAVTDEDSALARWKWLEEVEQRPVVVSEASDVNEAALIDARGGKVERSDAVASWAEQGGELVPRPGSVAGTVHQDDV